MITEKIEKQTKCFLKYGWIIRDLFIRVSIVEVDLKVAPKFAKVLLGKQFAVISLQLNIHISI